LRRLRDMGVTMLLAEQNMHFCRGAGASPAPRGRIDNGRIVYRNSSDALKSDDAVKRRYLAL